MTAPGTRRDPLLGLLLLAAAVALPVLLWALAAPAAALSAGSLAAVPALGAFAPGALSGLERRGGPDLALLPPVAALPVAPCPPPPAALPRPSRRAPLGSTLPGPAPLCR